jgi:hypothetical protein
LVNPKPHWIKFNGNPGRDALLGFAYWAKDHGYPAYGQQGNYRFSTSQRTDARVVKVVGMHDRKIKVIEYKGLNQTKRIREFELDLDELIKQYT